MAIDGWVSKLNPIDDAGSLHPGLPAWIRPEVCQFFLWVYNTSEGMAEYLSSSYQRKTRSQHRFGSQDFRFGFGDTSEDDLLDFLDFSLFSLSSLANQPYQTNTDFLDNGRFLQHVFSEGGSEWAIQQNEGIWGIEKRVPEEVAQAVAEVTSDDVSGYFGKAWRNCFGRNPDYSSAYLDVVRSMEAALCPLITPNDRKPTLGKVLTTLRDQNGKWALPFSGEVPQGKGVDPADAGVLAVTGMGKMLESIWHSHHDRHGKPRPEPITQEMAEAAVFAAIPVIRWASRNQLKVR